MYVKSSVMVKEAWSLSLGKRGKFLLGGKFPLHCEFPLKWNFSWNFSATNILSRIFSCTTFLVEDFFTNTLHGSFNINILSGNYVTNNFRRIFGEHSNVDTMNIQMLVYNDSSNTLTQVFPNTERLVHAYMQTRWFRFVFVFNTFRTSVTCCMVMLRWLFWHYREEQQTRHWRLPCHHHSKRDIKSYLVTIEKG